MSEIDHMTRDELYQQVLRWRSKANEYRESLGNVMGLMGQYPDMVPNELGLQAWASVKKTAKRLLSSAE